MMSLILALLSAASLSMDPISTAIESYKNIKTYQVTLKSKSSASSEIIRYYYKKPGFIRMDFVEPHKGAALVYDPFKKEVKLRPFPFLKIFVLTLSPDSKLIKSAKGHTVDASDIGALLKTVRMLQERGETEILGDSNVEGRAVTLVSVKGKGDFTVDDNIHNYLLWFDKTTSLPIKASAYDIKGELVEEVLMTDLEINVEFAEGFFEP